jgi:hypothetical protein
MPASASVHDALAAVPETERLAALVCHLLDGEETAADQIASAVFVLAHLATKLPPTQRCAVAVRLVQHAVELGMILN